jgi:hypothetical protein
MAKLRTWERGVSVESETPDKLTVYLWFYEWNMFDAVNPGQHTPGGFDFPKRVDTSTAVIAAPAFHLSMEATTDGADMVLTVTNRSAHHWPAVAGIIPCFNPGPADSATQQFIDSEHTRTYFLGKNGLSLLQHREIHFNHQHRVGINALAHNDRFVFSHKWPTADEDATSGLLVRESVDGKWVTGIAWEDFLSAQGHNPWNCMHLGVRVGPLSPNASKTIRGKIFLLPGSKEACLDKFQDAKRRWRQG